jgi:tetratricopeptide (TPR) repeat protein
MRRPAQTLLLATLALTGAVRAATTPAEIDALEKAGKIDDAIAKGRAATAEKPGDADLRLALARALAEKSRRFNHVVNVKVSQKDLEKGEIKVPNPNLGDTPLRAGYDASLFEEAQLNLDAAIKAAPTREDVRALKCFLLTDAGRIDRAKAAIKDAVVALPNNDETAKTFVAFGAERVKKDDLKGAAELMAPVAAAFPKNGAVQADYGNVLTRLGRKTDADAAFDRALAAAPGDKRTARTRAVAAMMLRDYTRARTAFDDLFRSSRAVEDQFAAAAAAYGADPTASMEPLKALVQHSASSEQAVNDLAYQYWLAAKQGPGSVHALSLGRQLVTSQQLVIAIPLLDRAMQANPKNEEPKKLFAKLYADLGAPGLTPK